MLLNITLGGIHPSAHVTSFTLVRNHEIDSFNLLYAISGGGDSRSNSKPPVQMINMDTPFFDFFFFETVSPPLYRSLKIW